MFDVSTRLTLVIFFNILLIVLLCILQHKPATPKKVKKRGGDPLPNLLGSRSLLSVTCPVIGLTLSRAPHRYGAGGRGRGARRHG